MTITQGDRDRTAREAMRELLAERVANGVELLDREVPGWWQADRSGNKPWGSGDALEAIDLEELDLGNPSWCVCGQLEQPGMATAYWNMTNCLFGENTPERYVAEVEHGFSGGLRDYDILTELWREVIEKRRADA